MLRQLGGFGHDKHYEKRRAGSAAKPQTEGPTPQTVQGLHTAAGNLAVSRLLSPPARPQTPAPQLRTTAATLAAEMRKVGKGDPAFAKIRSTLKLCEKLERSAKPDAVAKRASLLADIDERCTAWLNAHPPARLSDQDRSRRDVIERLVDELPNERRRVSQNQAEEIYMGNALYSPQMSPRNQASVKQQLPAIKNPESDPRTKFAFKAMTDGGGAAAYQAKFYNKDSDLDKMAKKHGLTRAEMQAIVTYSAEDYKYINTATANDSKLLASRANDPTNGPALAHWKNLANRVKIGDNGRAVREGRKAMMEEGALHTGMAIKGLAKLPEHTGTVYRGASFTEEDFKSRFAVGKKEKAKTLTSTSTVLDTAARWAKGGPKDDADGRTVSVVFVTEDSGGKLLGPLSAVKSESEVLVPPGIENVVLEVIELANGNTYDPVIASRMDEAKKERPNTNRKWFVVKLGRTKDRTPWKGQNLTAETIMGATPARGAIGSARR